MQARDTRARFRKKVKFLGVEGGLKPLIGSGAVSLALINVVEFSPAAGNPVAITLAVLPFLATFAYMALLVSGRRPHFARDLLYSALNGHAASPLPPAERMLHPAKPKGVRGIWS
jgi:hypothetical protein